MSSFGLSDAVRKKLVTVVAVLMCVYAILFVGGVIDNLGVFIPHLAHRSLILAFLLALCFPTLPIGGGRGKSNLPWYDILAILLAIAGPLYNFFTWKGNADR